MLRRMGSNINPNSVIRAGKSIGPINQVYLAFEEQSSVYTGTDYHPTPAYTKDFSKVLQVLEDENVMTPLRERSHPSFKFKCGLLQKLSQ